MVVLGIPASAAHLCPPALLMLTLDIPLPFEDGFPWVHLPLKLGRSHTSDHMLTLGPRSRTPYPQGPATVFQKCVILCSRYTFLLQNPGDLDLAFLLVACCKSHHFPPPQIFSIPQYLPGYTVQKSMAEVI